MLQRSFGVQAVNRGDEWTLTEHDGTRVASVVTNWSPGGGFCSIDSAAAGRKIDLTRFRAHESRTART